MSEPVVNFDGAPLFQNAEYCARQKTIAQRVGNAWGMEVNTFCEVSPLDWYLVKSGRLVCVAELKTSKSKFGDWPAAHISIRQWIAVWYTALGMGIPAVFVMAFGDDEIRWLPFRLIDPRNVEMNCRKVIRYKGDTEPCVRIPNSRLLRLDEKPAIGDGIPSDVERQGNLL